MKELGKPKTVKEVFKDYNSNSFELNEAKVIGINLYKRENILEINVVSKKPIDIMAVLDLEKYMQKRFQVREAKININYNIEEEIQEDIQTINPEEKQNSTSEKILKQWPNIVEYISHKHPIAKAFLKNSVININKNVITVTLSLNGKEFLENNKFNEVFSGLIQNIYGKKYNIEYMEKVHENDIINYREELEKLEKDTIMELTKNNNRKLAEETRKKQASASSGKKKSNSNFGNNYSDLQYENAQARKKQYIENKKKYKEDVKNNQNNENITQSINNEPEMNVQTNNVQEQEEDTPLIYGRSLNLSMPITKINDVGIDSGNVIIEGNLLNVELDPKDEDINLGIKMRELKSGKFLVIFSVYDGTNTIDCKVFSAPEKVDKLKKRLKSAAKLRIAGTAQFDPYAKQLGVMVNTIIEMPEEKVQARMDNAKVKRVELHMHTQMSTMDGITPVKNLIKRAMKWGMKSIAITDHGSVQAFPDAHKMLGVNNPDMKVLYGVEAYLVPDKVPSVSNPKGQDLHTTYCVLDLETTGLSFRTEKITEIGIMKVNEKGEVIDEFECFVNPEKPIPQRVVEVTNITDDMVKDAETIDKVLPKVLEFVGDSVIVAHNADFDVGFLKYNAKQLGLSLDNTYLDTLRLAKDLFPDYKKYKLGIIAEKLGIEVIVAHRALDDVDTTVKVFRVMLDMLDKKGAKKIEDIDKLAGENVNYKKLKSFHAIILATNYVGLRNLYKLISISHLDYIYKGRPMLLKSIYKKYSEGLILGSACEAGELYQAIENGKDDDEIEAIARDYDYLEIQPTGNNMFLVRNGVVPDVEALRDINRKIVALGEKLDKLVVATCDVHFMDPEDEIYRRILEAGQGYADCDLQAPLYLRTTEEMLEEFSYLGEEKAYEVVVTNTNKIADMCEQISPISPEKCPPYINDCEKTIKDIAYNKAHELYGDPLPQIVEERLDKELTSIIKNGFSVMYIIAQKLVWKSNADGYIVGSRGSVGSSFVANMTGITEVNSLPPHYRCPNCKYSDFTDYGVKNGFDLPDKTCPKCGHRLDKDGIDIPFETFLGFNGDKEPDIDLNFSGEYQAKAHRYTEVIFGKGTTFKAGTVGTVAGKTAMGYVRKYNEERGIPINNSEVIRVAYGCTGIKRTTGQHPGGIIVVPKGREIYEFTPVQHPADDPTSDIITTHFDYHSIDQNLLKLDILGHDDPTMIRMLFDITGQDPTKVPLDDKETMSIFSSTKALGVTPEQIHSEVGSFGVPEFGTKFVRGMLVDTRPKTFDELIRISGLSHGTDVWLNNAQTLIDEGTIKLEDAICCRDDIMIYLIKQGLPPQKAFKIMEFVRKGKPSKDPEGWKKHEETMREYNIPEWYIGSCKKIKYMFPKAHAAAYVTNAFRIAWFKVHIPKAYYAAYFTIRADAFDSEIMCHGVERVKNKMKEIELAGKAATKKDQDTYGVLEIVLEMYERGLNFLPIDLYNSDAVKFKVEENGIVPPLNSIPGLGTVAAQSIQEARKEGEFMSIDDMKIRAKIGKSTIEMLEKAGCLKGMSQSNQMSLFA